MQIPGTCFSKKFVILSRCFISRLCWFFSSVCCKLVCWLKNTVIQELVFLVLLMEILHHLRCIKPCKQWDIYHLTFQLFEDRGNAFFHSVCLQDRQPFQLQRKVAEASGLVGTARKHLDQWKRSRFSCLGILTGFRIWDLGWRRESQKVFRILRLLKLLELSDLKDTF